MATTVANEYDVPIDGVDGRVTVRAAAGIFSVGTLLLDGRPVAKSGRHGYPLPMRDGSTVMAQLRQSWTRPVPMVVLYGRKYEVGPKIGAGYLALIFLPFALVFVGGLVGGLFGGVGSALNRKIAFAAKPWWFRVPLMAVVAFTTFALYMVFAGAIFALKGSN